ncbi:NERD domain-containing protein [Mycoplasmopsis pullorum]|uniref:nuclease-related domain-containing protein n=1 Tax=Mycoplasmopsis pullorum TaxID=48003 RepID=UPI001119AED2|nr:nuclease-related domain-containing protein [Mycoplasmopsis pullorum]TNK82279.1 NERD domain-containing protein [Mycoplasmopsis pullorum]TNK83048.1 NERD domain-containing protein [Mycoplasmopsis pullorum]TNK84418.1 NERD domain-containing protein [Mycoplasmopsis pullorum]TNK85369.1 NERD domain-containing protein [Mycoplasmopsis pullorum]TNK86014.1 NERD domain-containing protein [Mycoplasmopsis pullorum]
MNFEIYAELADQNTENNFNKTYAIIGLVFMLLLFVGAIGFAIYYYLFKTRKKTQGFIFENNIVKQVKELAHKYKMEYVGPATYHYDGNIFEVDGIVFNEKFVIVLEYKSYKGHISGDSVSEYLYITNKNKGKKNKVSNFLIQNYKHIKHLYKMLNMNFMAISMIVTQKDTTYDIYNVDNYVVLSTEEDLASKFDFIYQELNHLPSKINIRDFKLVLNGMKANTLKEAKKFKKITKQNK